MKKRVRLAVAVAALGTVAGVMPVATAQAAPVRPASGSVTTHEKGHVVTCTGQTGARSVTVELYDNSAHGAFVNVSVEGPDGEYGGSSTPARLFDHGLIHAKLPVERLASSTQSAGTATLVGWYLPQGATKPVRETVEDGGWKVESVGTHQDLRAGLAAVVLGKETLLTCRDAFAYDLKVTRTPL